MREKGAVAGKEVEAGKVVEGVGEFAVQGMWIGEEGAFELELEDGDAGGDAEDFCEDDGGVDVAGRLEEGLEADDLLGEGGVGLGGGRHASELSVVEMGGKGKADLLWGVIRETGMGWTHSSR